MRPSRAPVSGLGELQRLLERYVAAADQAARDIGLPQGWCITAAALSHDVLPRLGVHGVRIIGVDFAAFNSLGWKLFCAKVPVTHWPDQAKMAGSDGDDRDDQGWGGHALAYVPSSVDGQTA